MKLMSFLKGAALQERRARGRPGVAAERPEAGSMGEENRAGMELGKPWLS